MKPTDLVTIQETIRRTLIECSLTSDPQPAVPPPSDLELERTLLGAVISLEVPLHDVTVKTDVFYLPLHRWIAQKLETFAATCVPPSVQLFVALAEDEGMSGDFIRSEVEYLTSRPWCSVAVAQSAAARLDELHSARVLIERLGKAVIGLRTGTLSVSQVRAGLRAIVRD